MARRDLTLTIRFSDLKPVRLLVWELRQLADKLRVEASPHAETLENALDRFVTVADDPRGAG